MCSTPVKCGSMFIQQHHGHHLEKKGPYSMAPAHTQAQCNWEKDLN